MVGMDLGEWDKWLYIWLFKEDVLYIGEMDGINP